MADKPTRVMHDGKMVDAIETPIKDSTEKWSEFVLDDGTVLRTRLTLLNAARIPGKYDDIGNPTYAIQLAPTIAIVATDELRKPKDVE